MVSWPTNWRGLRAALHFVPETDDPNAILCAYPVNNCVMKFTYSELASGKSNLTVLKEPGLPSFALLVSAQPALREVLGCCWLAESWFHGLHA